jgi:hypothetical protein
MRRHRRSLLLPATAAALALAACGGASREEFASEANAICRDIEADIERINQGQVTSLQQAQQRVESLSGKLDEAVRRLGEVELPGGEDGERAEAYVTEFSRRAERAGTALDQFIPALRRRDQDAIRRLGEQVQGLDDQRLDELARAAGATGCAGDGGGTSTNAG